MLARALDFRSTNRPVERAVRSAARGARLMLAVSGGRDSMALLHAAARAARESVALVATFDHGTGPVATRAAGLVAREAARLGFPVVIGRASRTGTSEDAWREQRLAFLDDVARLAGAVIATAHTRDDQVETVLIRVLRDAGPRGLAGLYAPGGTVRPFLDLARADVAAYARAVGARWIEDPTNASPRFLRNRVRRDLLPALERVAPDFNAQVLGIARRAAEWRRRLEDAIDAAIPLTRRRAGLLVPARAFTGQSPAALAVLWPAIMARAGARADRRGTDRVVAFARAARRGARIQLSGGWEIARTRDEFEVRRAGPAPASAEAVVRDGIRWDAWTFHVPGAPPSGDDAWTATLPGDGPLVVRRWRPGDRLRFDTGRLPRRVKRFLSDAGVSGALRARWPVVLAGGEVVWIPGVRRGIAATARPGRPNVVVRCELHDD